MSKFKEVLKNRNFFLLWIGQVISQLGDRLDQMALIAFVYLRAPGSTLEIAKILSFTIIPVFLIGPIAGVESYSGCYGNHLIKLQIAVGQD